MGQAKIAATKILKHSHKTVPVSVQHLLRFTWASLQTLK